MAFNRRLKCESNTNESEKNVKYLISLQQQTHSRISSAIILLKQKPIQVFLCILRLKYTLLNRLHSPFVYVFIFSEKKDPIYPLNRLM